MINRMQDRFIRQWLMLGCLVALFFQVAWASGCRKPEASAGVKVVDLLVLGGTVVTMNDARNLYQPGGVAVADGVIVAVGKKAQISSTYGAQQVIETGFYDLVIPGLVNGHNHAAMTLLRGVADDLALMDWLQQYIFPAEAQMVDKEFVRIGTELAALEMIRTGTTTFTDMYYFEETAAEVVDRAGLRAVLGETVIGFPSPDHPTPEATLEWTAGFIERWQDHGRVIPAVAPHAAYSVSSEILQDSAALARQYNVPLLIHLAETADEIHQIRELYDATPTQYLESLGFLGPNLVAFHAVWLNDDDLTTLQRHRVGLVHNPESNMKLASGVMRVEDVRTAGIPLGIGTDGAASNNDLDLFAAMLSAALLQKHVRIDPRALPATAVVAMATIEGARALHMEETIGSLEVGKRADIVVIDGNSPNAVPRYDAYSHLVYAAHGADVRATVVDGQVLYLDGEYRTLDMDAVLSAARAIAGQILQAVQP